MASSMAKRCFNFMGSLVSSVALMTDSWRGDRAMKSSTASRIPILGTQPAPGLIILMGLPGAGKTSLAQSIQSHAPLNISVQRLCFDEFLFNGSLKEKHGAIFSHVEKLFRAMTGNVIVILDDCMHLKSLRKPYWRLGQTLTLGVAFASMSTPMEECICRDSQRTAPVGAKTITKMHYMFEPLTGEQCQFMHKVSGHELSHPAMLWTSLQQTLIDSRQYFLNLRPPKKIESDSLERQSPIHEAHLAINRRVHEIISHCPWDKNHVLALKGRLIEKIKLDPAVSLEDLLMELEECSG